jgi:hypothetical protein
MMDPELGAEESAELTERTALVRRLNAEIREASERLPDGDDSPLEFYCECGCWQTVELTIAAYDSLNGKPVYLPGHPAATAGSPMTD